MIASADESSSVNAAKSGAKRNSFKYQESQIPVLLRKTQKIGEAAYGDFLSRSAVRAGSGSDNRWCGSDNHGGVRA
jgi:hypothetical protein